MRDKIEECDTCSRADIKRYVRVSAYKKKDVKILMKLACGRGPVEWHDKFDQFPLRFNPINKPGECPNYQNIDKLRKGE